MVKRSRRTRQAFRKRIVSACKINKVLPRCVYCGVVFTLSELDKCTMDHLVPLSKGGRNNRDNLVPCCLECNRKKANSIWERKHSNYTGAHE